MKDIVEIVKNTDIFPEDPDMKMIFEDYVSISAETAVEFGVFLQNGNRYSRISDIANDEQSAALDEFLKRALSDVAKYIQDLEDENDRLRGVASQKFTYFHF